MEKIRLFKTIPVFCGLFICLMSLLAAMPDQVWAQAAQGGTTISGIVVDDFGSPVPGTVVMVPETTIGTVTGADGRYSITVPPGSEKLSFSSFGFKPIVVSRGHRTTIDISLESQDTGLEEVVVVGFGTQKKESIVASITKLDGDQLAKTSATSISNALTGQIPGISTVQASGEPGRNDTKIFIRGMSTWVDASPLVLVDGVERDFNNVDPVEIESISVLKDASATAVFGVRGANGVIMITTKRGKAGPVKVNFTTELTLKQPINMVHAEDSYTTGLVMNEAYKNENNWGSLLSDEVLEHYRVQDLPYTYPNTDWREIMLKNGFSQRYNVNISGGTDFARVFASLSYLHDGDVINTQKHDLYDPSYNYDRYNYRFNVDMDITRTTHVSVDAGGYVGVKNQPFESSDQRRYRGIFMLGPMLAPYYPAEVLDLYPDAAHPDETGWRLATTDQTNAENPIVANSYSGSRTRTTNDLNLSLKLTQDLNFITPGLNVKAQASYNTTAAYEKTISYDALAYKLLPNGTWVRRVGRAGENNDQPVNNPSVSTESLINNTNRSNADYGFPRRNYYLELSVNYNRDFGLHAVTGMIVANRRKKEYNFHFPSYEQGAAARVTYAFDNRYLFEANLGLNGSEQFAPDKQYGFFPSFAAGYNLHNEKFFEPLKNMVSRAKIRGSYGLTGHDGAENRWLFTSSYVTGTTGWNYTPGLPSNTGPTLTSIVEEKAANLNAGWELGEKMNIGFEIGFLKREMFTLTMDFFREHRTGILMERRSIPSYAGIGAKEMNIGETQTKGYEIELRFQHHTRTGWKLWAKSSVGFSDNRITNYDDPAAMPAYQKKEGYRIGQYFAYQHTGWIQNADVAMTSARGGADLMGLGDTEWIDFNGDGVIDDYDRAAYKYSPKYPLYNYSFAAGLSFKGIEFDFLIQAATHISKHVVDAFAWPMHRLSNHVFDYQMDVWSPDNRNATYPAYHFDAIRMGHNTMGSDGALRSTSIMDASYLRLKTVNIAYNLPKKITTKIGMDNMKIYLRGLNLFTWAPNYPLGDPEGYDIRTGGSDGDLTYGFYPLTRSYVFGLQLSF